MSIFVPSVFITLYSTVGAVIIKLTSYSSSNLSCIISICRRPKNPHLNPVPRRLDLCSENVSAASFILNLLNPIFKDSYWSISVGKKVAYTFGFGTLYPGSGNVFMLSDIVSPTVNIVISLNPVAIYPTSPAHSSFVSFIVGVNIPISVGLKDVFI